MKGRGREVGFERNSEFDQVSIHKPDHNLLIFEVPKLSIKPQINLNNFLILNFQEKLLYGKFNTLLWIQS